MSVDSVKFKKPTLFNRLKWRVIRKWRGDYTEPRARSLGFIGHLKLFGLGFLMVTLVSTNTRQVVQAHYLGAVLVGFCISMVWSFGVRGVSSAGKSGGVAYATGAAFGTAMGILITKAVYGQ